MQEKKDTVTTLSRAELLHENIKTGKKARALRRKKKKTLFKRNAPSRPNMADALKRGRKRKEKRQNLTSKQQSKTKGKTTAEERPGEALGPEQQPG